MSETAESQGPLKILVLEASYLHQNAGDIREAEFLKWVMDYAKCERWLVYHSHQSMRDPSGFPDLVLVRPPRILFAELKRAGSYGRLRPTQRLWLEGLAACSVEAEVWTPSDIPTILTRLRRTSL